MKYLKRKSLFFVLIPVLLISILYASHAVVRDRASRLEEKKLLKAAAFQTQSQVPTRDSIKLSGDSEPFWSFGQFGTSVGASNIIIDVINGQTEIYLGGSIGIQGANNFWYTLVYNPVTLDYEQTFVSSFFYPYTIVGIHLADVIGSSSDEIAVTLTDGTVHLYNQSTKEWLSEITTGLSGILDSEIEDLDNDGNADLIFCTGNRLYVYSHEGVYKWDILVGGEDCVVGQMDGDPALEIAVGDGYVVDTLTMTVQWNKGSEFGETLVVADIDGDGMEELFANEGFAWARAYDVDTQTEKWAISSPADIDTLLLVDIDGDSTIELLLGEGYWGSVVCYDTNTHLEEWRITNNQNGITNLAVGDIDGDGDDELLWGAGHRDDDPDYLYVVNWSTKVYEWENVNLYGQFLAPMIGDLDGDGNLELVTVAAESDSHHSTGRIVVFDDTRTFRAMSQPFVVGGVGGYGSRDYTLYDVDGDNDLEIIVCSDYIFDGYIEVYDFHSDNTFTRIWNPGTTKVEDGYYTSVAVGDLENDGALEIIGVTNSGLIRVYEYNTQSQESSPGYLMIGSKSDLVVTDMNNDSIPEIIALVVGGDVEIYNGAAKTLDDTIVGPFTALTVVNQGTTPQICLGDTAGTIQFYSRNTDATYSLTAEHEFAAGRVDSISPNSTTQLIYYGSNGVLNIFNTSGLRWSSSKYGLAFGNGTVLFPGSSTIYTSGSYSINAYNYTLSEAKSITLLTPNGNQSMQIGTVNQITWETTGTLGNVLIQLSTDNGGSWSTVAASTANDGSYDWTVPSPASTDCLIRVSSGTVSDTSDSVFTITTSPVVSGVEITSPNGGEEYVFGSEQTITWSSNGSITKVKLQLSDDNGSTWTDIKYSMANSGKYEWTVPKNISTQCLVKVSSHANGSIYDTSDEVFTIKEPQPELYLTSPNGGEVWQKGSVHNITWTSFLTVGNVKLEYSTDDKATWTTIIASTSNDGSYSWTLPNTTSDTCYVRISEASDGMPIYTPNTPFSIIEGNPEPEMTLNRAKLYFGAQKANAFKTPPQRIIVTNSGGGSLKWTCSKNNDDSWIRLSNTAGVQSGAVEISIYTSGIAAGTYTSDVVFESSTAADSSPQTVNVTLTVYASGSDKEPFGSFDTPVEGSTVMSSIPVTGWALDDLGIDKVKIYRDPLTGEGTDMVYVGEAVMVDGARPDVESSYPGYPLNYQAGWGYMLLTNMLPGGGNGAIKLHAYAIDGSNHSVYLGGKSITCDNATAVKPFGAIDSPKQGENVVGYDHRNIGWCLTPMPNSIATNGSTIEVQIDGVTVGNPVYNIYREDIASLFPGYANSNGSMAYFDLDLSGLDSGLHTIQWTATDTAGNTDGIGSRYFSTIQAGHNRTKSKKTSQPRAIVSPQKIAKLPPVISASNPISIKTGYGKSTKTLKAVTNKDHTIRITLPETQRMVMEPGHKPGHRYAGYLKVGQQLRALPVGSTLDYETGKFSWQTGPAFLGKYNLVFVIRDKDGRSRRLDVEVKITPRFNK